MRLLRYGDKQYVATIKGVDGNYAQVTGIDSSMWDGEFILRSNQGRPYAVPGIGVANFLGMRVNFIDTSEYLCSKKNRIR